jgi:hypothetical protein
VTDLRAWGLFLAIGGVLEGFLLILLPLRALAFVGPALMVLVGGLLAAYAPPPPRTPSRP